MSCIYAGVEWRNRIESLELMDGLLNDPQTELLGTILLLDARRRIIEDILKMVQKCDEANANTPILPGDCPALQILREMHSKNGTILNLEGL